MGGDLSTSVGFPPWTSRGITIWWRLLVAEEHPLHTRLPHWTFPWVLVAEEHHPPFFLPVTESRLGRTCERSQSLGWGARQEVLTESSPACRHRVGRGMGEGVSVGVNRGTRQVCRHTRSTGRCQLCPQRPQQQDACRDGRMVPNEAPDPGLQWNQPLGLQEQGLSSGWPVLGLPGQRRLRGGEGGDRLWPPRGGRE